MSPIVTVLIVGFLVLDAIVVVVVLRNARERLAAFGGTMAQRREVLAAAQELAASALASSYDGNVENLPTLVMGLAPRMEALMRARGLEPTPTAVRTLLQGSLMRKRLPLVHVRRAIASLP